MSHKIIKSLILDSSKSAIVQVYMESDGVEGELTNYVLIDPATDFVESPIRSLMAVTQVWHSFSWFDGLLTFNDLNPYPSWQLTRDTVNYQDFRYFGGLMDKSSIDGTGRVMITTNGFANAGSVGTLVLEVRKNAPSIRGQYQPILTDNPSNLPVGKVAT